MVVFVTKLPVSFADCTQAIVHVALRQRQSVKNAVDSDNRCIRAKREAGN